MGHTAERPDRVAQVPGVIDARPASSRFHPTRIRCWALGAGGLQRSRQRLKGEQAMRLRLVPFLLVVLCLAWPLRPQGMVSLAAVTGAIDEGDNHVHDPSMIRQGKVWYLFGTGGGLQIRKSTNLITWQYVGTVFDTIPDWVSRAVGPLSDLWAPDISYWKGLYHLYYVGSQFGTNTSVIGLATSTTLDPTSKAYHWVDHGLVLGSDESDDWNAIDPNLAFDARGKLWLDFGSF